MDEHSLNGRVLAELRKHIDARGKLDPDYGWRGIVSDLGHNEHDVIKALFVLRRHNFVKFVERRMPKAGRKEITRIELTQAGRTADEVEVGDGLGRDVRALVGEEGQRYVAHVRGDQAKAAVMEDSSMGGFIAPPRSNGAASTAEVQDRAIMERIDARRAEEAKAERQRRDRERKRERTARFHALGLNSQGKPRGKPGRPRKNEVKPQAEPTVKASPEGKPMLAAPSTVASVSGIAMPERSMFSAKPQINLAAYPNIKALRAREDAVQEAIEALERAGLAELADQARKKGVEMSDLELEVVSLVMDLESLADNGQIDLNVEMAGNV